MILEIINKANEYSCEYKLYNIHILNGGMTRRLQATGNKKNIGIVLNLVDTLKSALEPQQHILAGLNEKVENLYNIRELNKKFSPGFTGIFKEQVSLLVSQYIQISSENCYANLIKPILDKCTQNQITKKNLQNLLCEFDPGDIIDVVHHPKLIGSKVSLSSIIKVTKLEGAAVPAVQVDVAGITDVDTERKAAFPVVKNTDHLKRKREYSEEEDRSEAMGYNMPSPYLNMAHVSIARDVTAADYDSLPAYAVAGGSVIFES